MRELTVGRPEVVWYAVHHVYSDARRTRLDLCAVMDWYSRRVLGCAVSNSLDTGISLEALDKAVHSAGCVPKILNIDQGSQFTSGAWIGRLDQVDVCISMDGKGRLMDNVVIERLWRSLNN